MAATTRQLASRETMQRQMRRARDTKQVAQEHLAGSAAGTLWGRLSALDFINQAMVFAATLLLMLFPFLIVPSMATGHDFAASLSKRMGLNHQASDAVATLFRGGSSHTVQAFGWIFLILGALGVAATLRALYERVFGLEHRGAPDVLRLVVWLGASVAIVAFLGWTGRFVRDAYAGPVFLGVLSFLIVTGFFWWTMHFLLARRIPWRELLPSAVATSVCWLGLGVFSSIFFSSAIVSNNKEYGPVGVFFILMSWLIAVGVVIVLGAVVGGVWRERGISVRAAVRGGNWHSTKDDDQR
jgi:membrane protein